MTDAPGRPPVGDSTEPAKLAGVPSRRRLLAGLGAAIVASAAGCLSSQGEAGVDPPTDGTTTEEGLKDGTPPGGESGGCSRPPDSRTATASTTSTHSTTRTTYGPTSGPDERVDRRPPVAPALPASGEWPKHRFDAGNTAANPDIDGLREGEGYWRVAGGSTPVVDGGTMFNVFGRDRDRRALVRRDPTTAGPCSMTPLVGYGVNAPPVVAGDRAFVTTFIEVFCCATDRDEVLWRGPEMDGIQAPPAVGEHGVYVNSGGYKGVPAHLRAFDREGGERWRYDTNAESKSAPALATGAVFVVATDGLHAVETDTGERRFLVREAGERWTTPVATDRGVYVAVSGDETKLVAVDPGSGSVRWRLSIDGGSHPPVVAPRDREAYTVVNDTLVAVDADDGSVRRRFEGNATPLARAGDVVYAAREGRVVAFDVDGSRLWSYTTEQVQISDTIGQRVYGVTPVDGALYVSARDAFHGVGPPR